MNSVLLSATSSPASVQKTTSSRASTDTSATVDDASGFAGVLANQAAPQPQNSMAEPSGTAAAGAKSNVNGPQDAHTPSTTQQGQHPTPNKQADALNPAQSAALAIKTAAAGAAIVDQGTGPATQPVAADNGKHTGNLPNTDTSLPDRFSQVIAAMTKVGNRAADTTPNGKNNIDPGRTAATVITTHTAATVRHNAGQTGTLAGRGSAQQQASDTNNSVAQHNTNPAARAATSANSPFTIGTPAHEADGLVVSHTDTELSRPENSLSRPEPVLASGPLSGTGMAPAGSVFSLIPGIVHNDMALPTIATISHPVFSKQWGPELGRQFASIVRPGENGSHIAELRLDPPELGPLRITININDSVVQALFTSAHATVRNAVEQALPQLQQQLEHEGLSLGHTSVDHDDGNTGAHSDSANPFLAGHRNTPSDPPPTSSTASRRAPDALVDTFA